MKDRKKHFLKDAVVVLIAVFMVTTVLPTALADTGNIEDKASQPIYTLRSEGIHILNIPEGTIMGSAEIDPEGSFAGGAFADYYIKYHDDYTENGLGLTAGGTISEAIKLTDTELGPYRGLTISEVIVSIGCDDYGAEPGVAYQVWAADGAQPANPSTLPALATGTSGNDIWTTIPLTTTHTIPASGDVWMGIQFTHAAGQYPMGFDTSTTNPNGEYLFDGSAWTTLTAIGYPGVWGYTVGVSAGEEPPEPEKEDCIPDACDFAIKGFTDEFMAQAKGVDVNGDKKIDYYIWNSLPKDICIRIANKGEIGIGELKLLADLYKKVCGPTVTIFKQPKYDLTQFPCCGDNYPFYFPDSNGWYIQDDTDGDSWVLQGGAENRWYDENQAWRCTKGEDRTYGADEDVYLGLSDTAPPNTYDNLTTPWFDIAGVACATVTFYQWCEGEYVIDEDGNVIPVDYGTIAYSLDNGTTWNEISMDDFLAYDTADQWVKVTLKFMNSAIDDNDLAYMHAYNIICDDCEPQEGDIVIDANLTLATLRVRFIWHKDPCLQFEGWYIDALEVKVTLDYELELACQTHEVIELPPCDPEVGVNWTDYCFPLPCDVEKDTWYELHIYGQVYDPMGCEFDLLNNEFKYQFKVADIHDVACIEILPDDPQYVQPGDMVNINVTVQNIGTYAEDNVPVDIKVGDVITTYQLEDHFESSPSGYSVWYFTYGTGTLTPYTWSKGWTQISNIYDNAPASARSMLPGNECLLFAENLGGMPTLPEDTCMMFMAPETVILDPNHNGKQDCGENIGAKMTFAAKYSMDINLDGEIGSAVSLAWMPEEGPWVGYFAWTALTESDSDGYENDWQAYNLDLYEEAKKSLYRSRFSV